MPDPDETGAPFPSGVILAAGLSARMGRPKLLLPLGDRPLLQHVVDAALASCLSEVLIVLGDRSAEIEAALDPATRGRVRIFVNPEPSAGQSSSLRMGVRNVAPGSDAVAVLLGDQPFVTPSLIDRIVGFHRRHGASAVRPVYSAARGRRRPGHPVILARSLWAQVETLRGDQGARALLAALPEGVLEVPIEGEPPADIDTWDEYQRASESLRTGGSSTTKSTSNATR